MQVGTGGFNGVAHGEGFVRGQIIHDDDVSGRKRRREDLLHIGQEGGPAVHGAVEDQRRVPG